MGRHQGRKKKDLIPTKSEELWAKKIKEKTDALKKERTAGKNTYTDEEIAELAEQYAESAVVKAADDAAVAPANDRSILTCGAYYKAGTHHRVELSELNGFGMSASRRKNPEKGAIIGAENNYTSKKSSVNHDTFDDLFIDFQAEMKGTKNNADIDLGKTYNEKYQWVWDYGDMLPEMEQCNYRIHFPIDVKHVYPVRTRSDGKKYPPDPLYIRIESETVLNSKYYHTPTGLTLNRSNMSSVRQIIININEENFNANNDRPLIFFYDGPEKGTVNQSDGKPIKGESVRQSQPVILNLNKDFRGILFAPNSPVVINGNGHKFEGFVVGKYFTQLMPESAFEHIELGSIDFYAKKTDLVALMTKKGISNRDELTADDLSNENDLPRYYKVTEETVKYTNRNPITVPVNTMFTDDHGNVQFTNQISASIELDDESKPLDPSEEYQFDDDLTFDGNPFNLDSCKYDSFRKVKLINYTYLDIRSGGSSDCFYTTKRSKHID